MRIGFLRKLRTYIPFDQRIVLYYGLFQSVIDYCCVVWGNTTNKNIDKVFILQKRALRTLFELPFDFPSVDLFSLLNVMSVRQRIFYFTAVETFKCLKGYGPQYFSDFFTVQSDVHDYHTRSTTRKDFYVPRWSTKYGQRSFQYRAAKVWNTLPVEIKQTTVLYTFKSDLKDYVKKNVPT